MINLLPSEARQHVLTEYWLRVISVWLLLGVVAGVLILTLLFPSYILVKLQLQVHTDTYQQVETKQTSFAEAQTQIRNSNTNVQLLDKVAKKRLLSTVLSEITNLQSAAIFVESITMNRSSGVLEEVVLSGEANTRDTLANFRNQLEASPMFATADLPLENLAREREVPFQIRVTLVTEDTDL